jgi:arylsulfatase A-like enzyme
LLLEARHSAEDTDRSRLGRPLWAVPRIITAVGRDERFDARNLVLISLDTLRADHLSGYGYSRATSPAIDRLLIERGTTFHDVTTSYPMTQVAHMSLFTGLYPAAFGEHVGFLSADAPVRTFPESLRNAGFETAAFTEGGLLSGARGFWYGFDQFTERLDVGTARETFAHGIRYLRRHRHRKFFLFLHTYQTHSPYNPAPEYRALFRNDAHPVERRAPIPLKHRASADDYDREIRETDAIVANLLTELDRLGLADRTYVVLVSDHGEAFGEHGQVEHGWGPHEEQLGVPLIVRGPDVPAGKRIDAPVSIVDVPATLLDLLGAPSFGQRQGISLYDAIRGDEPPPARPIYFEWIGAQGPRGVRYGKWKLVQKDPAREAVLYDLAEDPGETRPLTGPHEAKADGYRLLGAYRAEGAKRAEALRTASKTVSPLVIGERERQALQALGYIR